MLSFSFRFVFQIYQDFPNPNINYGLIVNETSTLTGTCAAWGSWDPPSLPPCIRKSFDWTIPSVLYLQTVEAAWSDNFGEEINWLQ